MKSIKIENFSALVKCSTNTCSSIVSFLPTTFEFSSGRIYGIISDFGCGSWGLARSITGNGQWKIDSNVFIDGHLSTQEDMKQFSGNILDPIWNTFFEDRNKCTVHNCLEFALQESQLDYTPNEIKDIFCLSDARYNRSMDLVSGEIWNISLALLFAFNKEIIAYPWLNAIDIKRFISLDEQGILDFLKKQGKILLVPSSQSKLLKNICDKRILYRISSRKASVQYR